LTEPHCLYTNISSYLERSGGHSSNIYLNVVHFLSPLLIRHVWQLKTVLVFSAFMSLNRKINRTNLISVGQSKY
jgi:hypothetical protein